MKWYIPCLKEGKKPTRVPDTNHFEEQGASISKITSQIPEIQVKAPESSQVDEPPLVIAENNSFLDALT